MGRHQRFQIAHTILCTLLLAAGCDLASTSRVEAQLTPQNPGDAPSAAGPLATDLSPAIDRKDLARAMRRVADWQIARLPAQPQLDWTFAALYPGLLAVPQQVAGERYKAVVLDLSQTLKFQPGDRVLHADDQAIGQSYLELYLVDKDPAMLAPIKARADMEIATPDEADKPLWWWCDALFMAPPVFADLGVATHDQRYFDYMDHEWSRTSALLYDNNEHLFSRDATFLDKHEKNGRKVFWSRGNGWVMGGLVRVIDRLPANSGSRAKYVKQLQEMAAALAPLQGQDGLWRPGLLDPSAYPLPEMSGSMFITYALAYGVNHGLLPKQRYEPIIRNAWAGAIAHIYSDGRLGCIQPIGSAPDAFTETSSYTYGVGAFLLAGSEIFASAR